MVLALIAMLGLPSAHASAQVSVSPTSLQAGAGADITVAVNAEGGKDVTRVVVTFDANPVSEANAQDPGGWSSTVEKNDDGTVHSIEWSRGVIDAGKAMGFVAYVTAPNTDAPVEMSITRASSDGTVTKTQASVQVVGGTAPPTTATSSTTAVDDKSDENVNEKNDATTQKKSGIGTFLIAFGIIVLVGVYMRGKRTARKTLKD